MKGGHMGSGRVPDPLALRRDRPSDQAGWTTLPSAGRQGEIPAWPLSRASARELALWQNQWTRPQAVMWEANRQEEEVAIYVRSLAIAEHPKAPTIARTLVRQQQEALGLSLPGMHRLRWKIGEAESRPVRTPAAVQSAARDRLRVVNE